MEIEAFLGELERRGVKLDTDVNNPTLEKDSSASESATRKEAVELNSMDERLKN